MTAILEISTIGDSLTEGSGRESEISENPYFPNMYQSYTYNYLKNAGISIKIKNYGIGGQIINEICSRFITTLPADIIVSMGGTNDVWRYSDIDERIEEDICETLLDLYEKVVNDVSDYQNSHNLAHPEIFLCSIPPFGNVSTLPKNGHNAILYINSRLEKWIEEQDNIHLHFCDVHRAMENDEKYMREGLAIADGVHFTKEGNKACGEAIAKCILSYIQGKK